jgi:uncharacterized membrane protein YidH (DUF202 family)
MVLSEVHQRNNKGDPNENHDDEESQQQRKKSEQEETETILVVDQDNNNDNTKNNNDNNTSNKTITIDVTTLTNMIVAAIEESKKNKKDKKEKKGENKDDGDKYDEDGNIIADPGKATPKDHMANERTFFKWIRMLFFIFIFGLYILAAQEKRSWAYTGFALMVTATCFLPYALYRYWLRQGMMLRKEKGGADKVGIYIFAGVFFIFLLVMLVNTCTTGTAPGKNDLSQDPNQAPILDATSF